MRLNGEELKYLELIVCMSCKIKIELSHWLSKRAKMRGLWIACEEKQKYVHYHQSLDAEGHGNSNSVLWF